MPHILTITMNPAIDVSTTVEQVRPTQKLRCAAAQRDPGGGGINVARVVGRLGGDVTALYTAGGAVGQLLRRLVDQENIRSVAIPVREETREDFTALETATGDQFRFVLSGPQLSGAEWQSCLDTFAEFDEQPDFVVASGSLPPGVPEDFYVRIAEIARRRGTPLALDASGAPLRAALEHGVDLVKPNLGELRALTGRPLADLTSWVEACESLVAGGKAKVVALSLGHRGALLVTQDGAWRAAPLPIKPASTVGAGDSFLAAMVCALADGKIPQEAFREGVAGGSAALLAQGTQLCHLGDMRELLDHVHIDPVT